MNIQNSKEEDQNLGHPFGTIQEAFLLTTTKNFSVFCSSIIKL